MPTLTLCSVTVIANSAPSTNRWTITRWLLKIDANHRSAQEYLGELYLDMNQPANAEKQLQVLKVLSLHRQMRGVRRPESRNQKSQTEVAYIGYLGELRLIGTKLSLKDASPRYALRGDTWKMIRRP